MNNVQNKLNENIIKWLRNNYYDVLEEYQKEAHPMDVENFLKMFYGDVYEKYLEKILEDF